jgi:hypothetical protein
LIGTTNAFPLSASVEHSRIGQADGLKWQQQNRYVVRNSDCDGWDVVKEDYA